MQFHGEHIPYYLLGDPGFAISEFIIPTFDRRGNMGPQQTSFNTRHCRARDVVERMFGQVKSRYRVLLKAIEIKRVALTVKVILTCFLLHNFCKRNGQPLPESWTELYNRNEAQNRSEGRHQQPQSQAQSEDELMSSRDAGLALRQKLLSLHQRVPLR